MDSSRSQSEEPGTATAWFSEGTAKFAEARPEGAVVTGDEVSSLCDRTWSTRYSSGNREAWENVPWRCNQWERLISFDHDMHKRDLKKSLAFTANTKPGPPKRRQSTQRQNTLRHSARHPKTKPIWRMEIFILFIHFLR